MINKNMKSAVRRGSPAHEGRAASAKVTLIMLILQAATGGLK